MSHPIFLAKAFQGLDLPILTKRFEQTGFTLVDIGGRRAVLRDLRLLAPFAHCVAVEPDRDEAATLENDAGWKQFTVVPAAIGSGSSVVLHLTHKPGMSSLLEPNPAVVARFVRGGRFRVVDRINVSTLSLDAAAASYHFSDACFLKLDTQGTELDILRSGNELVSSVLGVRVEVAFYQFYRGQPLFGEVDAFLRAHGFELFILNRTNVRHAPAQPDVISRRVTIYAQALYFREARTAEERVRLLGLLLAFAYFDLALTLADEDEKVEVQRLAAFATDQARSRGADAAMLGAKVFRDEDSDL